MKNKNIVLITIDALRASDVGCIGGGNLTPNIDKLAHKSVLFKEAISNGPGTPQSFPSIFASVYPLMNQKIFLSKRYVTLAQVLRDNGFVTMGFHSNPLLSKFFGWDKGFDIFIDLSDSSSSATRMFKKLTQKEGLSGFMLKPVKKILSKRTVRKILKRIYSVKSDSPLPYSRGEDVNRTVIEWLKKKQKSRFFLWVHYMDPHEPYLPPDPWLDSICSQEEALEINLRFCTKNFSRDPELIKKAKMLYDAEVKYVDHCVGDLIKAYDKSGMLEDTVIILTADHGESFFEHGERGHPYYILYEEVLRVPLIIYGIGEKKEVIEPVQLLDISPTILSILRIKKPNSFKGKDLRFAPETEIISESAEFDLDSYKYNLKKMVISYRTSKWKLIFHLQDDKCELYNLLKDPREQRNILKENKDIYTELKQKVYNHMKFLEKIRSIRGLL